MKRILLLILLSLFFFSSCSRTPVQEEGDSIEKMIDGWREMLNTIQASSGNPDDLRHKTFLLRVKLTGSWNIGITPKDAFEIRKDTIENSYKVYITNPYRLFENRGGLTRMTYIQGSLLKVGGLKGSVELGANVECIFRVRFFQDNGTQVNFSRLQEAYNYDFVTEPSNSLKVHSVLTDSVTFIRDTISDEPISLRIKLEDRSTKESYLSNEILIPHCSRLRLRSRDEIFVPRSAGQCLVHLKTQGNFLDKTTDSKMSLKEIFANNCPLPIRCKMKAQYAYVQKKKVSSVEKKDYEFVLDPNTSQTIDTSYEFSDKHPFDSKLYKAPHITKAALPQDAPLEEGSDDLSCQWEKKSIEKEEN